MNRRVQGDSKEKSQAMHEGDRSNDSAIESGSSRKPFNLFLWLAAALFIFALLYRSSYFALLWLPPYQKVDMTSQLQADYSAWTFVVFQPVDPALIEEIQRERGLPEQIIVDGTIWPTAVATLSTPSPVEPLSTPTPEAPTENVTPSSSVSETPYVESPQPTSKITLPESTVTPQPTVVDDPTKPRKTPRPRRTPKPDKPPKTN
jgi:hypothetical protein